MTLILYQSNLNRVLEGNVFKCLRCYDNFVKFPQCWTGT